MCGKLWPTRRPGGRGRRPMPVNRMPWGKYRGILLEDVPANYLRWVLRDCGNVSLHLRRAIQDVLARAGGEPDSAPAPGAARPTTVAACVPVLEPVLKTWF